MVERAGTSKFESGLDRATWVSLGLGAILAATGVVFESAGLVYGGGFFALLGLLFFSWKMFARSHKRIKGSS